MNKGTMTKTALRTSPKNVTTLLALTVLASSFGWVISGIFHELGHVLAVLSFGGHIIELQPFVLFGMPHTAYLGSFITIQRAIISVSGAGLVISIGFVILAFLPFDRVTPKVRLLVTFGTAPFIAQSISYVILPILYLLGISVHDDVLDFIEFSHLNPLLVSFLAGCITVLAVLIIMKRTRIISTIQTVANV